ncbi:unnamed protein product [Larinioides sclopetarius]|uniref:Cilia- and flagella-associated protein 91 n=1 Tax=Larinioides sclopetarius TaxID=280406 RepID=A0AAV2ARW0_9ARAC
MDMNRANFSEKNSCYISGADLCKFFDRPIETNPKVGDIVEVEEEGTFIVYEPAVSDADKFVSTSTQTDYRESEAQTDPWDPPFKVTKVLEEPEVLSIRNFSFGNGLPASLLEVNYISELRKNRKLKKEVEPSEDETFERKKQIICNQVRNDWNYKISILNEKQNEKLAAMKSSLVAEMKRHADKKEKILTNLWTHKMAEMNKQNSKLQQKLRKEIHTLESTISSKDSDILEPGDFSKRRILSQSTKAKAPISQGTEYMLSNYYLTNPAGMLKFC